jgi:hypothetical protein
MVFLNLIGSLIIFFGSEYAYRLFRSDIRLSAVDISYLQNTQFTQISRNSDPTQKLSENHQNLFFQYMHMRMFLNYGKSVKFFHDTIYYY